jgi:hypothetical protein
MASSRDHPDNGDKHSVEDGARTAAKRIVAAQQQASRATDA